MSFTIAAPIASAVSSAHRLQRAHARSHREAPSRQGNCEDQREADGDDSSTRIRLVYRLAQRGALVDSTTWHALTYANSAQYADPINTSAFAFGFCEAR